jgi:hypothetical protein
LQGQLEPETFVIDTGMIDFGTGCVRKQLLAPLAKQGDAHKVGGGLYDSLSRTVRRETWQLSAFTLCGFTNPGLIVDEADSSLLSLNYLSRYVVSFDFPNRMMYLRKGTRFYCSDGFDCSGLHVLRLEAGTVVQAVDPGSAAALAGIKTDDVLLRVGTKSANEYSLHELRALLCTKGKTLTVVLGRGSTELRVKLDLTAQR